MSQTLRPSVAPRLWEFIAVSAKDDQSGLITQTFLQDERETIVSVENPAEVYNFKLPIRIGQFEVDLEPARKRCFNRIGTTLDRGSAETKARKASPYARENPSA